MSIVEFDGLISSPPQASKNEERTKHPWGGKVEFIALG